MSKKTFEIAQKEKKKVIIQLKGNQKNLLADCNELIQNSTAIGTYKKEAEKGRNRIENRTVRIFENKEGFIRDSQWFELIKIIILVERKVLSFNTKTKEYVESTDNSFYLSNHIIGQKQAYRYIRNHWFVENKDHYVRDVTLEEDKSRIRIKPEIMSTIRSFALNILRFNSVGNIRGETYKNSLNYINLYSYQQFV